MEASTGDDRDHECRLSGEASSLAWGIRALTLLAQLFYAASWLTRTRRVAFETAST